MKILSDNELIFFKQNGYLIVDNIFSKKDLDTIKNIFQDMIFFLIKKAIKSNPDKKILDSVIGNEFSQGLKLLEEIDRKYILEFYDSLSIQNNPYIARLSSNPKVLDIINNLLNKSYKNPLFITSGSCVFAMPNDKLHTPNKWHTDVFYSIKDSEYIQVWAPLIEDTSNELGALHIMPKSDNMKCRLICLYSYVLNTILLLTFVNNTEVFKTLDRSICIRHRARRAPVECF